MKLGRKEKSSMPLNGKLGRKEKFYAIEWDSGGKKGKCQLVLKILSLYPALGTLLNGADRKYYALLFCMIV